MQSKEVLRCLRLMADTIEDLEITNIISCSIDPSLGMSVHLDKLTLSGVEANWTERLDSAYNWEKSILYKNIRFYALYTDEGVCKLLIGENHDD